MKAVRTLLLVRRGLWFVEPGGEGPRDEEARAAALELAELGYVPSTRLERCLGTVPLSALRDELAWARGALLEAAGGGQKHEPLFRRFPKGLPKDTFELWTRKVVAHFLQGVDQPCLFCRGRGTTHVLDPCQHVVCDRCFDGSSYSACPVCERPVDRGSPFFRPSPERPLPQERVRFRLLDLGEDLSGAARELFLQLCARPQALAPDDRQALATLVRGFPGEVLDWLPAAIPVKENVAVVLGTLLTTLDAEAVLPAARRHLRTATDVLRTIAVLSGQDGSLQPRKVVVDVRAQVEPGRWWGKVARLLGAAPAAAPSILPVPIETRRFPVAKLRRPLRRALLAILEGFREEALSEDLLRHRSQWVWVGEFLHPHEYAKRFPKVARAFAVARKKAPDGTPAPSFRTFASRVEQAIAERDVPAALALLAERPGELARRLDHLLRTAPEPAAARAVLDAFAAVVPRVATPTLVTLRSTLATRVRPQKRRVFWPAGQVTKGVSAPETRAPLAGDLVAPAVAAIEAELLNRFAAHDGLDAVVIDRALGTVIAPFNERTASPAAIPLPRGSTVPVARGKVVRLFLHWCQPEGNDRDTDLDLSVGFYDAAWSYLGHCSYSELQLAAPDGEVVARSAGDLQAAPFPDGATEYIDLLREPAARLGIRYAVMTVNCYAGLPFSELDRGFAGVMLRDDPEGAHFDPRTVELRFDLQGANGVYLPCVLDLETDRLHWLDVYQKGQFVMNTVEGSTRAITTVCPTLIEYFASGARSSLFDLALLHAAARAQRVVLRGDGGVTTFERQPGEAPAALLRRLLAGEGGDASAEVPTLEGRVLAALFRGDLELPAESARYVLFPERVAGTLGASDLLA